MDGAALHGTALALAAPSSTVLAAADLAKPDHAVPALLCLQLLSSPLVHAWLRLPMLLWHQAWLLQSGKVLLRFAMVVLLCCAWLLLHTMA